MARKTPHGTNQKFKKQNELVKRMLSSYFAPLKRILLQILLLQIIYLIFRSCFVLLHLDKFQELSFGAFLKLSFYGIRFDLSTITTINALYLVGLLIPISNKKWTDVWLNHLFVLFNSIFFLFEISDWSYFSFSLKRATLDVLNMVSRKGDFINQLPHFLIDFWYVPLIAVLSILLFKYANKKILQLTPINAYPKWSFSRLFWDVGRLAIVGGIFLITMRGGLQYIPIGNGNALQVTESRYVPIVLNSPFSIMHSYSGKLEELNFFSPEELKQKINPIQHFTDRKFQSKNVVVLILESFSKEFTGLGGRTSRTHFLDSLMTHSLVFTQAYANGLHSAEGIPAVLSGIPTLMDEPITTSAYGTNRTNSLASLLREKGYETSFFHGGSNGTMSFDLYASGAGFQHYFGRNEYPNSADYDGSWGIWDEPYLQYFNQSLSTMKQPFLASVFTLSSHDPFKVPNQYEGKFPKGNLPIEQCIGYTDFSLQRFFKEAAKQPWFNNTLFVITADHCTPTSKDFYYAAENMGRYAIPILFYAPGDSNLKGVNKNLMQQIDILPSILDYLGYDQPFFAFGNSAFQTQKTRFLLNELSNAYQYYENDYLLTTAQQQAVGFYHFKEDSLCAKNLIAKNLPLKNELLVHFQAYLQAYRYSLVHNAMTVETWRAQMP